MNCFQKLLSSWWRTTQSLHSISGVRLWIAFKNYYLRDEGQPEYHLNQHWSGCELLSKIIIFVMKDNYYQTDLYRWSVVNCFQKLLSSWWRTTKRDWYTDRNSLWIAFKNYYLRDEGQLIDKKGNEQFSCELLSKIIIFVMKDNKKLTGNDFDGVVNCFQKLLSSWWRTTKTGIRLKSWGEC